MFTETIGGFNLNLIIIGVLAILIGCCLIPIGYNEFKEELDLVKEQQIHKKFVIYLTAFFDLFNFLGWTISLGILLILIGLACILISVI